MKEEEERDCEGMMVNVVKEERGMRGVGGQTDRQGERL